MKNYYRVLKLIKDEFSIEKLEEHYTALKTIVANNYIVFENDNEKMRITKELEKKLDEAYSILSNEEKRKEYDIELDREKTRKSENNVKSCINMYDNSIIKSVLYRKKSLDNEKIDRYEYTDQDNNLRIIRCRLDGTITYVTENGDIPNGLYRYEVQTISKNKPENSKYMVTASIDNSKLENDLEYRKVVYEKLFSEKNLEMSKAENYEYLGNIEYNSESNEYNIEYNQREFCASVGFVNKLRRKVNKSKEDKSYKFIEENER